ncbi:hypothetical protein EMEDMD4_440159 [Sinorhizobium medicae]|uniref:Uncharacterized protein n=1 Tax=Sinorhizobium medicae TaxID=110321 RepID=A0A508X4J7_9HYPH|nr:hypothetical protein EMEDMD4_440159 [Sinorhizobium medicae]
MPSARSRSNKPPLARHKAPRELPGPAQPDPDGAIAQLGERLHGMQEVSGSIPLSSTKISG